MYNKYNNAWEDKYEYEWKFVKHEDFVTNIFFVLPTTSDDDGDDDDDDYSLWSNECPCCHDTDYTDNNGHRSKEQ